MHPRRPASPEAAGRRRSDGTAYFAELALDELDEDELVEDSDFAPDDELSAFELDEPFDPLPLVFGVDE